MTRPVPARHRPAYSPTSHIEPLIEALTDACRGKPVAQSRDELKRLSAALVGLDAAGRGNPAHFIEFGKRCLQVLAQERLIAAARALDAATIERS